MVSLTTYYISQSLSPHNLPRQLSDQELSQMTLKTLATCLQDCHSPHPENAHLLPRLSSHHSNNLLLIKCDNVCLVKTLSATINISFKTETKFVCHFLLRSQAIFPGRTNHCIFPASPAVHLIMLTFTVTHTTFYWSWLPDHSAHVPLSKVANGIKNHVTDWLVWPAQYWWTNEFEGFGKHPSFSQAPTLPRVLFLLYTHHRWFSAPPFLGRLEISLSNLSS